MLPQIPIFKRCNRCIFFWYALFITLFET